MILTSLLTALTPEGSYMADNYRFILLDNVGQRETFRGLWAYRVCRHFEPALRRVEFLLLSWN